MPAIKRDITIEIGAYWDSPVALKVKATGAAYDLTGCEAAMRICDEYDALLLELTTANGRLVIDGPAGTIQRRIGATITAAIAEALTNAGERGYYDMEIIPGGMPDLAWKLYRGKVTFIPERPRV